MCDEAYDVVEADDNDPSDPPDDRDKDWYWVDDDEPEDDNGEHHDGLRVVHPVADYLLSDAHAWEVWEREEEARREESWRVSEKAEDRAWEEEMNRPLTEEEVVWESEMAGQDRIVPDGSFHECWTIRIRADSNRPNSMVEASIRYGAGDASWFSGHVFTGSGLSFRQAVWTLMNQVRDNLLDIRGEAMAAGYDPCPHCTVLPEPVPRNTPALAAEPAHEDDQEDLPF